MNVKHLFSFVFAVFVGLFFPMGGSAQVEYSTYPIPLDISDGWQVLSYSSIPSNTVQFDRKGMSIAVDKSASPLIFPIEPQRVSSVDFQLEIEGALNLGGSEQGQKGADDFLFRVGLVYEGKNKLGFFERAIAADWIKTLFSLAPKGLGVDRIQFYNVYSDPVLANKHRVHPLSDLISESFVIAAPQDGNVKAKIRTDSDKKVLAIWISSDGDDTESSYLVKIKALTLNTPNSL